jgi:hypothetical protein
MKSLKIKQIILMTIIPLAFTLALLLLIPFTATGQEPDNLISGRYAGTIVITEPVQLGVLDLAFDISKVEGTLTGTVVATQTQVYLGAPALQGSITSSSEAITSTFRLDSEDFSGEVSGRTVERRFTLVGEVLNEGDVLQGQYEETIEGFTPDPLLVRGTFLVVRPSRSAATP